MSPHARRTVFIHTVHTMLCFALIGCVTVEGKGGDPHQEGPAERAGTGHLPAPQHGDAERGAQHQVDRTNRIVWAIEGANVTLPCHIKHNATQWTLEWTKDNQYVYLRENNGRNQSDEVQLSYRWRTSVRAEGLSHGDISMTITGVKPEDEGEYLCYVPELYDRTYIKLMVADFSCQDPLLWVQAASSLQVVEHPSGVWCKDPLQSEDHVYVMPRTPYGMDKLYEYDLEDFQQNRSPTTTYNLPSDVDGTSMVVYNATVFYIKGRTCNIVKYDLHKRIKSGETNITNARSDIVLAVDEMGLWIIYTLNGHLMVIKVNPSTLGFERTWETSFNRPLVSNAFMACGLLYGVYQDANSQAGGDLMLRAYNPNSEREEPVPIAFPHQRVSSMSYSPKDKWLYLFGLPDHTTTEGGPTTGERGRGWIVFSVGTLVILVMVLGTVAAMKCRSTANNNIV